MATKKKTTTLPLPTVIAKLTVTVTKTADGKRDYVQIMSSDLFTVNVVLIAEEIIVEDHRA